MRTRKEIRADITETEAFIDSANRNQSYEVVDRLTNRLESFKAELAAHPETVALRNRKNAARRERHAALTSLGLKRVKGALGGIYYE